MLTIKLNETFLPDGLGGVGIRLLVASAAPLLENETLQTEALAMLSPQRRAKAEACSTPRVRALSIGVALALDCLLEECGKHEREMSYQEGEHGKPRFDEGGEKREFNLSHSGNLVAAAMLTHPCHAHLDIGVDIQHITRYRPELVRRVFNADERAQLAACTDEAARERRFAQLWCRAEAYAKATGEGLRWPFPTPPQNAHFADFNVGEDYCGSLCWIAE